MLGLIVGIVIAWYFYNYIDNNSYLKNVIIYSSANFVVTILENLISGEGLQIISSIIGSIIAGLLIVKIMEFAKKRTSSLVMFVILTELCIIGCSVVITLLFGLFL